MRDTREGIGWKIVQWSATLAFAAQVVAIGATFGSSSPELRLGASLIPFGFALLRGAVAYGVWYRARWAAWVGGLLAALTVVLYPVLLVSSVETGAGEVTNTPLSQALAWVQAAAAAAFLGGLVLMWVARRRQGAAADSDG